MSDKETLSPEQREDLCFEEDCGEHNDGNSLCPIPLYKDDLQDMIEDNASVGIGNAEPKTATATVVRSDE